MFRTPVEDLPVAQFEARFEGYALFIVSSHVIRNGDDAEQLILEVLARLACGDPSACTR